jgi:hypothetical protein
MDGGPPATTLRFCDSGDSLRKEIFDKVGLRFYTHDSINDDQRRMQGFKRRKSVASDLQAMSFVVMKERRD